MIVRDVTNKYESLFAPLSVLIFALLVAMMLFGVLVVLTKCYSCSVAIVKVFVLLEIVGCFFYADWWWRRL